ncbi:MAG: hypothetical protein N7Q72_05920, partial [Spiroplasma sp. Tabriz.8]|nr:hypothetical protein [Spiroplasma sp. Tabriz.8]
NKFWQKFQFLMYYKVCFLRCSKKTHRIKNIYIYIYIYICQHIYTKLLSKLCLVRIIKNEHKKKMF